MSDQADRWMDEQSRRHKKIGDLKTKRLNLKGQLILVEEELRALDVADEEMDES